MGDYRIFVDNLRFSYEGPFQAHEMFRTINNYLWDRGYDQKPMKEFEYAMPNGKYIEWQRSPWKKITDYVRMEWNIRVIISELVRKDIIIDGQKRTVDHGKVLIIFNAYMETDYDQRWESRAMFHLIRMLYDKYFYKDYTKRYEYVLKDHVNQLYAYLQRFFNVYSTHKLQTLPNSIVLHD
ncbi:TPA: hypothetical protein HA295_02745 [Candidatus Woesearchaeota archaeon]|nr:hypothetical protein [Candidatus Woesearchaeota archaeon]HII65671.1 hypothetical protein [Candidatus Woesearchaeota archaeon]